MLQDLQTDTVSCVCIIVKGSQRGKAPLLIAIERARCQGIYSGRKIEGVKVRVKRDSGKCSGWRRDGPIDVCYVHPSNKRRSIGVQACYLHGIVSLFCNLLKDSRISVKDSISRGIRIRHVSLNITANDNEIQLFIVYFSTESSKSRGNSEYHRRDKTLVKPFSGLAEKGNCQPRICTWKGS